MEEEKAAAYYEELTRKGEGAARFKQGLGFSSSKSSDTITKQGSPLASSSSFLSSFVKASSPTNKSSEPDKQSQLENIQNKLKTKKQSSQRDDRDSRPSRRRSRSRDRYDSRHSRNDRGRDRGRSERRRRSRSRSDSDEERRHRRRRSSRERRRSRSRSCSPRDRRRSEKSRDEGKVDKGKSGGSGVDYSKLIKGYADMSAAERVKAKMKFQLSQTAEKDADRGMGAGWERFEFNKDAPLDDEEIEAAEDDAAVVKKMGQSFRFSAVEARREEQIKAAHDQAMFGAPVGQPSTSSDDEPTIEYERTTDNTSDEKGTNTNGVSSNLVSDKVLAKQQGSWRDRARQLKDG